MSSTMPTGKSQLVRALETANAYDAGIALDELVDRGMADDALAIVERRVEKGDGLRPELIARLIVRAPANSQRLLALAWPRLRDDPDATLILYRSKTQIDERVEKCILDRIVDWRSLDDQPRRRMYLQAVNEFGSNACLETLNDLLVEARPAAARKRDAAKAVGTLPGLEGAPGHLQTAKARVASEFVDQLSEAIASIEARSAAGGDS